MRALSVEGTDLSGRSCKGGVHVQGESRGALFVERVFFFSSRSSDGR